MSASLMRQPLVLALLFLPSGCLVGVLLIYPLVNGVWLGFTDASPLNRSLHFVGLANFIDLLTDPEFWEVLWNTWQSAAALAAFVGQSLPLFRSQLKGLEAMKLVFNPEAQ